MADEKHKNNGLGLGIAGLVFGIITLVIALVPFIGLLALIPGICGIILSSIGLSLAFKSNSSKRLITTALIISIIATLIAPLWKITINQVLNNKIESATKDIEKEGAILDSLNNNFNNEISKLKSRDNLSNVSISDFSRLAKDYETLLKELEIKAKKAKAGDMNSITEFTEISLKITNVATKISSIASSLNAKQVKEFEILQNNYDSIMNKFDLKK